MNPLLSYGIQVIIVSGLLYSYYHVVLRNKKFHRYNRFYLLAAAGLSVLIPLLNIPVYFSEAETESSVVYNTLRVFATTETDEGVTVYAGVPNKTSWFTTAHIFQLVYITIAIVVLLRVIFSLMKIRRIIRQHPVEKIENISFLNTDEPGTPFSFFRWLFWNRKIELNSEKGEQIFRHELFHIEQKHSLDILFFEFLTVAGWFNPFFHLMKRETKAIHEFLADQFAVNENNRWDYAELLLMQVLNTNQKLVHPFFHNQIKRRIAMITSPQKTSHQYLRKLMVLPVTAIAVMLFAFSYKSNHSSIANTETASKKLILIDIGHGGSDPGAMGIDGTKEKDIALSIAHHIKELNKNLGFNIEFTREGDMLPDLKARIKAGEDQPSLFLSLHINSSPDNNRNGIEVYIPNNGHPFSRESQQLGTALLNQLQTVYTVENKLLQRSKSVWVLENSNCPAALLEVGYISNNNDLRFFAKSENQELVAEKILSAISTYLNQDIDKRNSINTIADTTGKPELITKKEVQQLSSGTIILSDSIIYKSDGQRKADPAFKPILIVNGKRIFESNLKDKVIVADKVISYSEGDKEAIKVYGTVARNGVLVFFNAKIIDAEIKEVKPEADKIFDKVEIEASYPGGMDAWRKYLERNLNADVPLLGKAPAGVYTVIIQFIVNLDGTVSDARALTHHGYGMEAEAIRAIERGGNWLPAIQNGRQVKSYRKQPITFMVDKGPKKEGKVATGEGLVLNEVVVVGYSENLSHGVKTAKNEITLYNTTQVKNGNSGYVLKLAADELYIGIDNIFRFDLSGININELIAEITPNGRVEIKKNEIIINVSSISESHLLSLYITEGNKKTLLKTIQFKVRLIPLSEIDKSNSKGTAILTSTPEISVSKLKTITACEALGLPAGTEVISYKFTIDKDNGNIVEIPNSGITFNPATKNELQTATAGKLMTFDLIRIRVDGKEKRVVSRVYLVVN